MSMVAENQDGVGSNPGPPIPADKYVILIYVKIIFSDHAKSQRIERKIPKEYILDPIKNPQKKIRSFRNRELLQRQFGAKILEVVTVIEDQSLIVITEYWLEKEES